jgi:hypothetical protein
MAELEKNEIFVIDLVECGVWEVSKIVFTKETPKCYVLRGGYRDRHFKKKRCFQTFKSACNEAFNLNHYLLETMERNLRDAHRIMESQDPDVKPEIVKWERHELLDL